MFTTAIKTHHLQPHRWEAGQTGLKICLVLIPHLYFTDCFKSPQRMGNDIFLLKERCTCDAPDNMAL